MSFGGSVLAMIVTLRNNARPRRKAFEYSSEKDSALKKHYELNYKTVSASQIQKIRRRIRRKAEREDKKQLYVFLTFIALVSSILIFASYRYTQNVQENNAKVTEARQAKLIKMQKDEIHFKNADIEYFLNDGKKYNDKGDFRNGKIQFYKALEVNPDSYNAYLGYVTSSINECIHYNVNCHHTQKLLNSALKKYGETPQLVKLQESLNKKNSAL